MTRKVLILTGAPDFDRLDWAPSNLLTNFECAIAQFALLQRLDLPPTADPDRSHLDLAVWRYLSLHRTHIRTGFSQQYDLHLVGAFPSSADFLNTTSLFFDEAESQGLSQQEDSDEEESNRVISEFYEQSLAVHDDLASSQIVPHPDLQKPALFNTDVVSSASDTATTSDEEESDEGDAATMMANGGKMPLLPKAPFRHGRGADHLSDLEDIPAASYIVSIQPATMTATLIVGIISIAAPRTIKTRYGATMTLVEVLVGDETKSGFSVTFWLADKANDGMLAALRSQDVVLMQNVALNVFRKRVYGGSLRCGKTKVWLLYRGRKIGSEDDGGYYDAKDLGKVRRGEQLHPQLEKTRRVRDWVLKFVGGSGGGGAEKRALRTRKGKERTAPREWNQPPPLESQ